MALRAAIGSALLLHGLAAASPVPSANLRRTGEDVPATQAAASSLAAAPLAPTLPGSAAGLAPGILAEQYHESSGLTTVAAIDREVNHWYDYAPKVALQWRGFLRIEEAGVYQLGVVAVGHAKLDVSGTTVLSVAGNANLNASSLSSPLSLSPGFYPVALLYSEQAGSAGIELKYSGPDTGSKPAVVPAGALWHRRGPCALAGLAHVTNPPCAGPRWALGDGESCPATCQAGYFADAGLGKTRELTCSMGVLSPAGFACEARGDAKRACQAPNAPIAHGAAEVYGPCLGGASIPHGQRCIGQCAPGYRPSRNLTCNDGELEPQLFACVPALALGAGPAPAAARDADADAKERAAQDEDGLQRQQLVVVGVALLLCLVSSCCFCRRKARDPDFSDSEGRRTRSFQQLSDGDDDDDDDDQSLGECSEAGTEASSDDPDSRAASRRSPEPESEEPELELEDRGRAEARPGRSREGQPQPQHMQPPGTQERLLASSWQPMSSRGPRRSPVASASPYDQFADSAAGPAAEAAGSAWGPAAERPRGGGGPYEDHGGRSEPRYWGDVRVDEDPANASRAPWSDVRVHGE